MQIFKDILFYGFPFFATTPNLAMSDNKKSIEIVVAHCEWNIASPSSLVPAIGIWGDKDFFLAKNALWLSLQHLQLLELRVYKEDMKGTV